MVVLALMVPALAAAAGPKEKVDVCHIPPGNPGNAHTITVSGNALKAHEAHGDTKGECAKERPGRVDDDDDSSDDKTSENREPIARAGDDRCVADGASYELDGSASSDPDGDDLEFDWDVIDRPTGSDLDGGDLSYVQAGADGTFAAQVTVIGYAKTMGLISHALHQEQTLRLTGQLHRLGLSRQKNLFLSLC